MELPHITQGQHTPYYCGPAAVRCALSCRGLLPSQESLAVELRTTVNGTDSANDVVRVMNAHLGAGTYAARFVPGQDATPAEKSRLKADLVASIDAGHALVANVVGRIATLDGKAYAYNGGHYVAVVGYRSGGDEALVADIAIPRDYWVTTSALATWIAARGYSYPVAAATGGGGWPVVDAGAEGVDYSFQRPTAAGLAAAGKRFAGRYVGPGSGKHLDAAERDALVANGIAIFLLAEGTADGAAGGYAVGRAHAQSARAHARTLGFPDTVPIYYAVDYDITAANWPPAREYLRGACDVDGLARVGVYGDVQAMEWAQRDGVAAWFFQTLSASSWSQGRVFAGNHVEQYRNGVALAGGTVDLCRAKAADFGQWPAGQRPTNAEDEDDMIAWLGEDPNGMAIVWINGSDIYYRGIPDNSDETRANLAKAGVTTFGDKNWAWTVPGGRTFDTFASPARPYVPASSEGGGGGPVKVSDESVAAIADATADTLVADPERDGPDK